jgi:predicted MPP superfamily phosphohydrolase
MVARVRVPLAKLPASMSGTRIVQISDLHFGGATGPAYLAHVVAMVNALEPDLVAITGDLLDGTVAGLGPLLGPLGELRARYGVYFVTGNHEYYWGANEWIAHLPSLGLRVLDNERVSIGGPEGSFDLAGVSDPLSVDHGGSHDIPRALAGRDPSRPVVLLAHQPSGLYEASQLGVSLQLSGHTHGGQLYPLRYVLMLDQPFVDGLHRLRDTWIYVTRGAGYWGPPMRLGAPPEVAEITLVSA